MRTALKTLKHELIKVTRMQSECVSQEGYVLNDKKYEYSKLTRKAKQLKDGINYLEDLMYMKATA